jgi:hypothetical protein
LPLYENNNINNKLELIQNDAKEITIYYLELHKDMINSHNLVYSKILQNNSSLSRDLIFTNTEQFIEYQLEMKNMYRTLMSNRDETIKIVDNIINKNLDTFIKSIEITQKFYKDIIESYLKYVNKL